MNWNEEARREANRAYEEMFSAHRGAFPSRVVGHTVIFGNDAYTSDGRTRAEVAKLRDYLGAKGIQEVGFGTGDVEGYTWAMIVRSGDSPALHTAVWWAWGHASGIPGTPDDPSEIAGFGVQGSIATSVVLGRYGSGVPAD